MKLEHPERRCFQLIESDDIEIPQNLSVQCNWKSLSETAFTRNPVHDFRGANRRVGEKTKVRVAASQARRKHDCQRESYRKLH
jgi:hypothetical protein